MGVRYMKRARRATDCNRALAAAVRGSCSEVAHHACEAFGSLPLIRSISDMRPRGLPPVICIALRDARGLPLLTRA